MIKLYTIVSLWCTAVGIISAEYRATKVDEQNYIQNSLMATSNGLLYATYAGTGAPFDLQFIQKKNTPVTVATGLWDLSNLSSVGTNEVFFKAGNEAVANAKTISPFLFSSAGKPAVTKLANISESADVVIDAAVQSGNQFFFKLGTSALKSQIWAADPVSLSADTAYAIATADVINSNGNSKYRMVDFKNELYLFTTTDSLHYDVFRTNNRQFANLTRITAFNTITPDSMAYMIAGPDTLYMFYKSGSASKLYCYDGNNTDYIGLTATSLGLTDIITIGNTLYYSANKALYKVSGKTISAIPTPFGATTTMNWVRAVGHKVAYIATDATYGKEARIYNPADNSVKVADAAPGTASNTGITYMVPVDDNRFVFYGNPGPGNNFYISDGVHTEPIILDGETTITSRATPVVADGYIYFVNYVAPTYKLFAIAIADIDLGNHTTKTRVRGYYNQFDHTLHTDTDQGNTSRIDIFDISGRMVQSTQLQNGTANVRNLPAGVYIAKTGGSTTIKFIVE